MAEHMNHMTVKVTHWTKPIETVDGTLQSLIISTVKCVVSYDIYEVI